MKISVCSIMHNEEALLRSWLEVLSTLDQVMEINLVDCGSIDKSVSIAREYDKVTVKEIPWERSFSALRNTCLDMASPDAEWIFMPDIDEQFCNDPWDFFDWLQDVDLGNVNCVEFPHVKFWDWNRLWFHKPNTLPTFDPETKLVTYSLGKCTTTLYRPGILGRYSGTLHENVSLTGSKMSFIGSYLRKQAVSLDDLEDDFFMGHYCQAKMCEQARIYGSTIEYQEGLKRSRYRQIVPQTHADGVTYDLSNCENPSDKIIEDLGKEQLTLFLKDHIFVDESYDSWSLNNKVVKRHYVESKVSGFRPPAIG